MSLNSQAAEIELLFLRGVLPSEFDLPREPIRLVDSERHLSVADVIEYLVSQSKPVRCRGRLTRGLLVIEAKPPTSEQLQFHTWLLRLPAEVDKPWRKAKGAAPSDLLRVKCGKETVVVSFEAFGTWERDYVRTRDSVVTGPQLVEETDPDGPRWEAGIGYTGPPVESYSLQEDERVLCERCREQLAVSVFRDRTARPVAMALLCEHCLRAEAGRELARTIGIEQPLSDKESHQLLDNVYQSLQDELRRGDKNPGS